MSLHKLWSTFKNARIILESYYQIIDCTLIGRNQVFETAEDGSLQPRKKILESLCLTKNEFLTILFYDYFNQGDFLEKAIPYIT